MDVLRHAIVVGSDLCRIAFDLAGCDYELLVRLYLNGLMIFEGASAYFWAGKIGQNCQRAIHFLRRRPRQVDIGGLLILRPVRHVEAHTVHTRREHCLKHTGLA